MRLLLIAFMVLATFAVQPNAYASSNAAGVINDPDRVLPFAKRVERELAERRALVAIVARVGRDPEDLPEGIEYTHVGIWVYSEIRLQDEEQVNGYAVYNLYQSLNDPGRSELVTDFPPEFFGNVVELEAGVIIPAPEVQRRILEFMQTPGYEALFVPEYSLVANPLKRDYQNCTGFVLNTLIGAVYRTSNVAEVQAHVNAHFVPQKLGVSLLERVVGSLFLEGVATRDHDGDIRTATFASLRRFMEQYDLMQEAIVIRE